MRLCSFSVSVAFVVMMGAAGAESFAKVPLVFDPTARSISPKEVEAFRNALAEFSPASSNVGNQWIYGNSGQAIEALGLVYQISGDRGLLEPNDRSVGQGGFGAKRPRAAYRSDNECFGRGRLLRVWPNKEPTAADSRLLRPQKMEILSGTLRIVL